MDIPKAPRSATTVMYDYAIKQGWDEASEAGLLAGFIDEKGLVDEFEAYLKRCAEFENGATKT